MSHDPAATVLVVDDNPATRYSTSRVLKSGGFDVLEAATGVEAIAMAAQRPSAVVLDVNLPDMDGFQVCRELRAISATARTPVIHLSATFVTDLYKIQGLDAGADGYLTHPVEPLVLIATVNAFLRARKAEEDVRQSEAKFRSIFNEVQDGICLMTQDLVVVEANPAMCQMLGQPHSSLIGASLRSWMDAADIQTVETAMQQLAEGSWQGSFLLQHADSRKIQFDWRLTTYSVPGQWLAIMTDATERLQAEAEREQLLSSERVARSTAERANRLKDDFLATLSHELRTPLSAILGWAQILRFAKQITPQDFADGVEAIERNAKVQTQLIEDLLDVSRITSGKLRLEIQPVEMATIASAAIESVTPAAIAKDVAIIRILDPNTGQIAADPSRLQQVIWNLVSNAVKFSQKGGKVVVRVQRIDSSVEVAVIDEGQGISPEFLPHIFERFRQEDASSTRSHGGLGLGLAIVKHLVELHGGTVRANSRGLDQGAEFIIRLPIASIYQSEEISPKPRATPDRAELPNYLSAGNIAGVSVLLVDDDADTRILMERLLSDCGAVVRSAAGVAQALETLEQSPPQLLISDIGMPTQSGYDLIRQVRQRGFDMQRLPAIAVTAFARGEDRRSALSAGFQLHLEKPIDPGELVIAIASLLGKV